MGETGSKGKLVKVKVKKSEGNGSKSKGVIGIKEHGEVHGGEL